MTDTRERKNRIRFDVTMDDVVAFNEFHLVRSPEAQRTRRHTRAIFSALIAAAYFLLGFLFHQAAPAVFHWWFPPLCALLGGGAFYLFGISSRRKLPGFMRRTLRKMYSQGENKSLICEHVLEVDESGITETTGYTRSQYAWGALERVEVEEDYTYLYVGAVQALIIPHKRIVEGDYPALLQAVKRHYTPGQLLAAKATE